MYQIDVSTAAGSRPLSTALGATGFFTDGNAATGVPATVLPAEFLNAVMLELMNVITGAGLALNKSAFNQLFTAIQTIGQSEGSNYSADTGSANTYAASYAPTVSAPTDGMLRAFKVKTTNTGASTFALDGSGTTYPIYGMGGFALQGGEIVTNGIAVLRYNSTLAGWVLIGCGKGALQVAAATQSGQAVNLGQFAALLSPNGYIKIPNANGAPLILQWGQATCAAGTTTSTTFPLTFPSTCLNVGGSGNNATGNTQAYATVNGKTASGFNWSAFLATSGSAPVLAATAGSVQMWYFAIGY